MTLRRVCPSRLARTMIEAPPYPWRYRGTSWEFCVQQEKKFRSEPNQPIEWAILVSPGQGDGLRFQRARVITGHRLHLERLARHAHDKPRCELRSGRVTESRDLDLNQIQS